MSQKAKIHITADTDALALIDKVIKKRRRSAFIMQAALEKARMIQRKRLADEIKQAFEEDVEFFNTVADEWENAAMEDWPKT